MTIAAPLIAVAVVKTDGRDIQWIFTNANGLQHSDTPPS